jgi:hypothetical protein
MSEDQGKIHDDQQKLQRTEHRSAQHAAGLEGLAAPGLASSYSGSLVGDSRLNGRGNQPMKAAVMRQMQQTYGNRAVQRQIATPGLNIAQSFGDRAVQRWQAARQSIQRSALAISQPGDHGEQEAEMAADTVMRMPDGQTSQTPDHHEGPAGQPSLQRACSCGGQPESDESQQVSRSPVQLISSMANSVIARAISSKDVVDSRPPGEDEEEVAQPGEEEVAQPGAVQRKAAGEAAPQASGEPAATPDLAQSIDAADRSGGQPLPSEARHFMEPRFGHDFGDVRVHTDQTAGNMAIQLQARAFTTGNSIFFAQGEFQPDQTGGKHLLAHELAHVVQQSTSSRGVNRQIQRVGNGGSNCKPYLGYDTSKGLATYNCAGLAHRTYDYKSLTDTKTALSKGAGVGCGTTCDELGKVKHWLWEYDMHAEDSKNTRLTNDVKDFHTVAGPTGGDPMPVETDEVYSKNGARKVYGPGTGPSFRPATREPSLVNDPSEAPQIDPVHGQIYKVRSNYTESCSCLPCP